MKVIEVIGKTIYVGSSYGGS